MALNRQREACFLRQNRCMSCHRNTDLARADVTARSLQARDALARPLVVQHFAVLDDVHTERIGGAGIAPDHCIVARCSGIGLQHGAVDRKARFVGEVEVGRFFHHVFARQDVGAYAVQAHGVGAPYLRVLCAGRHGHVQIAARREHHVVVQVLRHAAPQRHGMLVKRGVVLHHVIRAHDGRVAPCITRADIAFLQHRYVFDAVVFSQVIRGG